MKAGWERWYVPQAVVQPRLRSRDRQACPLETHALARSAAWRASSASIPRRCSRCDYRPAQARPVSPQGVGLVRPGVRRLGELPRTARRPRRLARTTRWNRATRCSTSHVATAAWARFSSIAASGTAGSTRRRRWWPKPVVASVMPRLSIAGDLNQYVPPAPVAATTVFRAVYYARDRRAFFEHVAGYTVRKLVFDLNPRQYRLDVVVDDLRAAGFDRVVTRPFFVPQRLALPAAAVSAFRLAERSGLAREARAPVSLHVPGGRVPGGRDGRSLTRLAPADHVQRHEAEAHARAELSQVAAPGIELRGPERLGVHLDPPRAWRWPQQHGA